MIGKMNNSDLVMIQYFFGKSTVLLLKRKGTNIYHVNLSNTSLC